jgi:hypothetical protein
MGKKFGLQNKERQMVYENTAKWVGTLTLNDETQVLAGLVLALAEDYDKTRNTSTAGELRKAINELRRLTMAVEVHDPLEQLLTR